jgi:hypothetical protein
MAGRPREPDSVRERITQGIRFPCPDCDRTYAGPGGMKQHWDKHHGEPKYQCQFCARAHACSSNMKRHLLSCKSNPDRIPPSEGKFKCLECETEGVFKVFKQKGNLKNHIAKQHPNPPSEPEHKTPKLVVVEQEETEEDDE